MKIKTDALAVIEEYRKGVAFNTNIDLYETVKKNENFYIGKQWEGLNAPGLEKPTVNILKRVVAYFLSSIVSDDIAANVTEFTEHPENMPLLGVVSRELEKAMELAGVKAQFRDVLRDAAIDGDGCMHFYFDPDVGPNEFTSGQIMAEVINNTNVYFGNPQVWAVEKQPYILISFRRFVDDVREEIKERNLKLEITEDKDPNGINEEQESGKVTVVRKYYKKSGTVWVTEVTESGTIMPPKNLGYKRYPITWMSWDKIKNQYHGQAAITGMIDNQIFVNKLLAMSMVNAKQNAFPKTIYNKLIMPDGWDNRVGAAIPVMGNPNEAIAAGYRAPNMSNDVNVLIDSVIGYTRDTMGASDAALGNTRPDNTSAIIAVQKASSMPLELQRMAFYQFVEDMIRIFIEMMAQNYGMREVGIEDEAGTITPMIIDFSQLQNMNLRLNIEIGAASYWSELMQVQIIDNLFSFGIIQDPEVYLKAIPEGYLKNKGELIRSIKERRAMEQQMAAMGIPVEEPEQKGTVPNIGTMPENFLEGIG